MSNLALNEYYSTFVDKMKIESGDRSNPIWLVVNPKYPAVRYHIWAPILDAIQDRVFRKLRARIDTRNIFIINAVSDIGILPNSLNCREAEAAKEIVILKESVLEYQPKLLITFGMITYEFVKRVLEIRPEKGSKYWNTTNLGEEFERSIANFDITQTNRIPLLHRVMKNDKFILDRNDFSREDSENYFREVGVKIADRIIENKDNLRIWIE